MVGGCNIEGEDESWDFGTGAGFYVDATEDPWKTNYRMYSYVRDEVTLLPGYSGMVGEAEEGMLVDEVFAFGFTVCQNWFQTLMVNIRLEPKMCLWFQYLPSIKMHQLLGCFFV